MTHKYNIDTGQRVKIVVLLMCLRFSSLFVACICLIHKKNPKKQVDSEKTTVVQETL